MIDINELINIASNRDLRGCECYVLSDDVTVEITYMLDDRVLSRLFNVVMLENLTLPIRDVVSNRCDEMIRELTGPHL